MHKAASHLSRALKSVFAAIFALVALIAVNAPLTHAAPGVRANVTYQARLMDASGYPVADGVYQVRFSLYDAAVAGTRLWTAAGTLGAPTPVNVSVQDGLFTVLLGDGVTQIPFGDLDWNSDSLYLGVTIGADAEMSPRRPITAVPQAINSAQLGGMSASSSDTYGGQTQFSITQASTTAATSTRSALDVRSNGSSVANDYILRAIGSTGVPLFTVNSQGTVSTTDLLVDGIAVCRADGTDCLPVASGTSTLQDVYDEGNAITLGNNAFELTAIASGTNLLPFFGVEGYASFVAKGFGEGGLSLVHASSSFGPTTTYMFFTSDVNDPINATSSYIASQMQSGILQIAADSELGLSAENQGNISLQTVGGNIILNSATTTLQSNLIMTGDVASDFNPFTDDTYSLGTPLLRWNGYFSGVTTTFMSVAGQSVCLEDGTNCPVAGSASLQDAYDGSGIGEGRTINLEGGPVTLQWYASGTDLIGSPTTDGYGSLVSKGFGDEGFVLGHTSSSDATSTFMFFTSDVNDPFNATTSYISSEVATGDFIIASQGNLGLFAPNQAVINVQASGGDIILDSATTTLQTTLIMMGEVASQLVPDLDATYLLGTSALRWNGFFSGVTTTYLSVAGQSVCLQDGTNCPVASSASLQDAYDNGNTIVTASGSIQLVGASSTVIGGTLNVPLIEGVFASGTNEGFDINLFRGSNAMGLSGTGTSLFYRDNKNLAPGFTTSAGIGFGAGTSSAEVLLFSVNMSGASQTIEMNGRGIGLNPGMNATTTFSENVALSGGARVDSNLIPRYDGTFALGSASNRWDGNFSFVTSTYQHLQSGVNPANAYSGAMLINNINQGVNAGLDIVTIATTTPTQLDNILFLYRADRSVMDQYAEFAMGQDSADGYHKLLLEVKEGSDENDLEMTPTSTKLGGDVLPKNNSGLWLGSNDYRWNGYFNTVSTSNMFVNGQTVCLQNGVNCPVSGAGTLQDAYDGGRFVTLTTGQIELTNVTGTASDFFLPNGYTVTATRVLGAANQYNNTLGFDLSVVNGDGGSVQGAGTLFTFTDNRFAPFSSDKTSFLRHSLGNGNDNILEMGNVSSSVRVTANGASMNSLNASIVAGINAVSLISENNSGSPVFISNESLTRHDALMIATNAGGSSTFSTLLVGDIDPDAAINGNIADLYFRYNSTAGSGTQLYTNVDGSNTGWRGLATVDMLPETPSLQGAYNAGKDIVTQNGPVTLYATTTGPDMFPAFPWVDAYRTLVSEGFDNDGISFMHGSGTWDSQHYIDFFSDESLPPGAGTSSYIMGDTLTGNVNIFAFSDLLLQTPGDEIILNGATTTFQSNLVMDGTFVGSNLTPFVTDLYDLGTSVRRWNEVHANNVSLLRDTVGTNLTGPFTEGYSVVGGGFEGSGNEGFDIIMFSSTTNPASGTGTVFMFATEDRTANVLNDAVTSTGMRNHITPSGITSRLFSRHNGGVADLTLSMGSVSLNADAGVPDSRITVNPTDILIDPFTTTTMQGETNLSSNFSWPVLRVENQGIDDDSWGAHIDRLLVGTGNPSTTGTNNYAMVITYSSSTSFGGLCLDDNLTAQTCPSAVNGSIVAEGGIIADAFDLAETYESPDTLEPGDIVIASTVNEMQVVRSNSTTTLPMGIVSTEPGVLLGYQKAGAHPIALAGRVPTKVSTINGEIKPGDLLAPTQIPGVAGKAVEDGPIVGIALQAYNGADIGKIEVFVKTSWYSKPNSIDQVVENNTYITNVVASEPDVVRRGLAKIETGAVKVHISFETLNGYPFVQTTPRGLIVGAWSTDNYTDTGFDIILEQPQTFDVVFGWEARALDGSTMMIMSDGTSLLVDPATGQVIYQEPEEPETDPEIVPEPSPEPTLELAPEPTPEPTPEPSPEPVNP